MVKCSRDVSLNERCTLGSNLESEGTASLPILIMAKKHNRHTAQIILVSHSFAFSSHDLLSLLRMSGVISNLVLLPAPFSASSRFTPFITCSNLGMWNRNGFGRPNSIWRCLTANKYTVIVQCFKPSRARKATNEDTTGSDTGTGVRDGSAQNLTYLSFLLLYVLCVDSVMSYVLTMLNLLQSTCEQLLPSGSHPVWPLGYEEVFQLSEYYQGHPRPHGSLCQRSAKGITSQAFQPLN